MDDPFIGEIGIVAFPFAPRDWALCNGQLLSIAQNTALFSILGTTYGGDGQTTFGLPDLRGRAAMHWGDGQSQGLSNRVLGEIGGQQAVTLNTAQMPAHTHVPKAVAAAGTVSPPGGMFWAGSTGNDLQYDAAAAANTTMAPSASGAAGGNQQHENMPPVLTLNFVICLYGYFPSRN